MSLRGKQLRLAWQCVVAQAESRGAWIRWRFLAQVWLPSPVEMVEVADEVRTSH
jgi:hypothetical protein